MRNEFLPFTKPDIKESDIEAVVDVLRSGWITNGPKNIEFEEELCRITGNKYAVALSSATAGMHILMKVMDIGPGDEVITPSLTWVSTVNMIVLAGATPVFAEIDRDTLMVTPQSVKSCITAKTKLIIPVHYAGAPFDIDGIRAVAGDIPVVDDAAHAIGTYYKGRHVCADGSGLFSFHAIKNVTTAEGGALVTDDEEIAKKFRSWKFHGLGVDAFDRSNRGRSPQAEVIFPGFKYNLTDMQAALGLGQLKRLSENNARREQLALRYRELLDGVDGIEPLCDPEGYDFKNAWHLFIVRVVTDKMTRNEFMEKLKNKNIGTGLHFTAAHVQKYYRENMGFKRGSLPNTEFNSDRICSLPLFSGMSDRDQDDVVQAIKDVLSGN
ncbi:MAG: aminotransferase class I/II-fold pyridoxal phosphate-dependent enzyme [Victivallaceae bacterium]|nr:aminotransferase class I/II-fold pyridoxal phosphate-dependent enzyme [Victivallaceae bacterium]MDD4180589.1 aminotransferase class I/II-fold pyridoxal phosphate-dependent enzyme [Victivallaceae bacterium]